MAVNFTSFALGILVATTGCRTVATSGDLPARIINPTDTSRAALQNAVNDALNTSVLIADDALTTSNILTVERRPPAGMQGRLATGRNMDPPIQFRLVINDSVCVLIDARDDTRYALEHTTCIPQ